MMRTLSLALALLLPAIGWAAPFEAATQAGPVALIAATTAIGEASVLNAGLRFDLAPEWKIYWRTPGDAGYPPSLDWAGSGNIGAPVLLWPAPRRLVVSGIQDFGYEGRTILPLTVPVTRPGQPVRLAVHVDFLACAKLCVPMTADLALDLPAGPAAPSDAFDELARARALVPGDGVGAGLRLAGAVEAILGDSALRLAVEAEPPLAHPDLFVESASVGAFAPPEITLSADGRRALITVKAAAGAQTAPLAGNPLTLTLADGARAMEVTVTPVAGTAETQPSLPAMLLAALLGGFILNLMPCVLPVLSLKIVGAIGHGGAERSHVRAAFLASGLGVITSFLGLAAAAIALKSAGLAVGWGMQFQQPGFLAGLAGILALFAANLWGLWEVPLPAGLINRAGSRIPHHTILGHFLSGAFATLLATPCSAPFLGTAVGFALARGAAEIWAVFAALGLGMAVPYFAVAIRPEAAIRLPKPGPWMVRLRQFLGLALGGTALWLMWVLRSEAGTGSMLLTGGALVAAVFLLAVRTRMPESARSAAVLAAVALAVAAVAAPYPSGLDAGGTASEPMGGIVWRQFDADQIAGLVADGKTVFVDVTADWCVTCKVNKAAVIDRGEVLTRMTAPDVVAMRADWTRPDPIIARYLASFGRYGVPFNAVYGPGAPQGLALSELLSDTETLAALDAAGRR